MRGFVERRICAADWTGRFRGPWVPPTKHRSYPAGFICVHGRCCYLCLLPMFKRPNGVVCFYPSRKIFNGLRCSCAAHPPCCCPYLNLIIIICEITLGLWVCYWSTITDRQRPALPGQRAPLRPGRAAPARQRARQQHHAGQGAYGSPCTADPVRQPSHLSSAMARPQLGKWSGLARSCPCLSAGSRIASPCHTPMPPCCLSNRPTLGGSRHKRCSHGDSAESRSRCLRIKPIACLRPGFKPIARRPLRCLE